MLTSRNHYLSNIQLDLAFRYLSWLQKYEFMDDKQLSGRYQIVYWKFNHRLFDCSQMEMNWIAYIYDSQALPRSQVTRFFLLCTIQIDFFLRIFKRQTKIVINHVANQLIQKYRWLVNFMFGFHNIENSLSS